MDFIIVWFIMTNGTGYIPPQDVRLTDMRCGIAGAVIGVLVDRPVNPTTALWPDPKIPDQHCEVDISQRVAGLPHGEYHLATTIVGNGKPESYIGHDPHTSTKWLRSLTSPGLPGAPTNFRVIGGNK